MIYQEEILYDKYIVLVNVQGSFEYREVAELGFKFRKKAFELNFRLIFDFTETVSDIQVNEIQSFLEKYRVPDNRKLLNVPIAYISNKEDYSFFKLMQHMWDNKGVQIMVFRDLDSGIRWFEKNDLPS